MVKIRALPLLLALTALACAFPAMADSRSGPISTLQWYWNDGNWSSAQSQILTPGTDITFSASFSAVDLPAGLNWLHYRVKDSAGKTSVPQHLTFYRPDRQTPDPVSRLEYFANNDGDWSSAQSQTLTPGTDITFSASFSAVDLPAGLNWLHYRVKDNAGKTSIPQHLTFYRPDRQTPDPVSRLEYFADNDPGLGQATQIDLVDGTDVQQAFQINMGEGGIGFRNVGVRV